MKIREAQIEDAESLAILVQEVEETSKYMLWEAGERQVSAENQARMITNLNESDNSTILVAEHDGSLVGYLFAIGGTIP